MGEKIYIKDPPDDDVKPRPVVPLEYAGPGCRGWVGAFCRRFLPMLDAAEAASARIVTRAGGPRQIVFATGVGLVLGGIGCAIDPTAAAAICMTIGGLMIGLVIRLPERWR